MPISLEDFLLRHRLVSEDEASVARASHPGLSLADAAVAEGFLTETLRADAEALVARGHENGLVPHLPGLVLLAVVGTGSRGKVYRAWQESLRRLVAVKVFPRSELSRKEDRTRFVREARIASRLEHPALVRAWDIGSANDWVFIVLEYVEGETLKARLDRVSRESANRVTWLPLQEALVIATAVAEGLAYAAVNGITHRDIKPANIQLNDRFTAKILDLGLARPEGLSEATVPLTAPGTPAYIAPEQARGEPRLTPKVDVYALGVVAYRMIAGVHPFEASSAGDMLQQHISATPDSLEERARQRGLARLPDGLSDFVGRMMAKRPEERPDAAEVAGFLRYYANQAGEPLPGGPAALAVSQRVLQVPTAAAATPSGVRGWTWLLVAAAVGGAAGLGFLLRGDGLSERERELGRREQRVEKAEVDAERLAIESREFARAALELARAGAAERDAGPPHGSFEDRLKRLVQEHGRLLGEGK